MTKKEDFPPDETVIEYGVDGRHFWHWLFTNRRKLTPLQIARQNSLAAFSTEDLETAVRNLERRGDLFCKLRPNGELAWCHRDYKRVTQ